MTAAAGWLAVISLIAGVALCATRPGSTPKVKQVSAVAGVLCLVAGGLLLALGEYMLKWW